MYMILEIMEWKPDVGGLIYEDLIVRKDKVSNLWD